MITGTRLYLLLILAALLLAGAWYVRAGRACPDLAMMSVSTDRSGYTAGETVHITIQNSGDRPVDVYCPSWCALGNFPTTLERLVDGRWEYFAGFCPSVGSPFENRGTIEGDYIRHSLAPGGAYQLEISNFEALHLQKEEILRIVYYLCGGREPVYSGTFTFSP